uniref:Phlebovirus_G2 domain-containing protein n=1 Tax=Heterorhabditis bacteriophora TaxID=37862 RepID=A0A1I7WUY5_HETBA
MSANKYKNASVGYIDVRINPLKVICRKVTHFYTRDSTPKQIPELSQAFKYPGNVRCSESCAGWFCGCALPGAACMFYKVAHIPRNPHPYEFFTCASWTKQIEISMLYVFGKKKIHKIIQTRPYETNNKISDTIVKITSLTMHEDPLLNSMFAESREYTVIVPEAFVIATHCDSDHQARYNFSSCSTREVCFCSNNGVDVDCDCPVSPLASLHKRYETTLPITTPRLRLYSENSELIAETEQMEATIAISSFMNVQLSVLVDSPPCSISLSPIQGCYRCLEGAEIIAFCKSDKSAIVELRCADKSFAIQCDPSPKKQILKFHYNSAIILDNCESSCGNKNVSLVVEGILKFHSENVEELRKLQVIHQWHASEGMPDLNPLLITLREHWKITLAAGISTAALIAGTYFWGPIVVIFLINAIFLIIGKIGTILKALVCCFKRN